MPTYGFQCGKCEHEWEVFQAFRDPIPECPQCHNHVLDENEPDRVKRIILPCSFVLNGSGWSSDGYSG